MAGRPDVVVVGGGHNGLVAAALLARAGRSVTLLERSHELGGAAVSETPFPGVDVRLSRYAYLVSLFPRSLATELGIELPLARRAIGSCTPDGERSLLIRAGESNDEELVRFTGDIRAGRAWRRFYEGTARLAGAVFPTLTEPLITREQMRARVADDELWEALIERPLGEVLDRTFTDDTVRGIVATDALIGTFASLSDPGLAQNRCFLYHVIGNGDGAWDVPVGGMGAVSAALAQAALAAGVEIVRGREVTGVDADENGAVVRTAGGGTLDAGAVVWAAPARGLFGGPAPNAATGCQTKINMVLTRLPRLRDRSCDPREAFAGTLHVHEAATQLERAYRTAAAGRMPSSLPCEIYCHTLTDRSILGPELAATGAQTLTLFGLHTPYALFTDNPDRAREQALRAALTALDAEFLDPIESCLMKDAGGRPCIEVRTPLDLEHDLGMDEGNIFHGGLQWPWVEDEADAGRWGVETELPGVVLGSAAARRGGGVSGIPGHNAARALLERSASR